MVKGGRTILGVVIALGLTAGSVFAYRAGRRTLEANAEREAEGERPREHALPGKSSNGREGLATLAKPPPLPRLALTGQKVGLEALEHELEERAKTRLPGASRLVFEVRSVGDGDIDPERGDSLHLVFGGAAEGGFVAKKAKLVDVRYGEGGLVVSESAAKASTRVLDLPLCPVSKVFALFHPTKLTLVYDGTARAQVWLVQLREGKKKRALRVSADECTVLRK